MELESWWGHGYFLWEPPFRIEGKPERMPAIGKQFPIGNTQIAFVMWEIMYEGIGGWGLVNPSVIRADPFLACPCRDTGSDQSTMQHQLLYATWIASSLRGGPRMAFV